MLRLQSVHVHRNEAGTYLSGPALRGSSVSIEQYATEGLDRATLVPAHRILTPMQADGTQCLGPASSFR